MAERGTFLVPTTCLADAMDLTKLPPSMRAKAEAVFPKARQTIARAIKAGVKIAIGTDAPAIPHGEN
jgi:imidazolonepropionase-like amidohydrolase